MVSSLNTRKKNDIHVLSRTALKREKTSVDADSMPGKRVLSSRETRKGIRRETRARASGEEASGYVERCRDVYAYATLHPGLGYGQSQTSIITYRIATRLYASGKAEAGVDGVVGATNRVFGMAISSGGRAGRDAGALTGGVVDEIIHQGAGMSSTRSGLVSRVLVSSEVGSCMTRVKRERSSGVSAAHILSAEALSTNF
jgi:hypothetical protein